MVDKQTCVAYADFLMCFFDKLFVYPDYVHTLDSWLLLSNHTGSRIPSPNARVCKHRTYKDAKSLSRHKVLWTESICGRPFLGQHPTGTQNHALLLFLVLPCVAERTTNVAESKQKAKSNDAKDISMVVPMHQFISREDIVVAGSFDRFVEYCKVSKGS